MHDLLDRCLADLSARIDDRREQANLAEWMAFIEGRISHGFFCPSRRRPSPPGVSWPDVGVNEAIADADLMLLQQFRACSDVLAVGGGDRLCVRCNYGTAILPSLFGCQTFFMPDEAETLPTSRALGGQDSIRAALDAGVPNVTDGLGGRVFETAERFLEVFQKYPTIGRNVALYHPDVQGPIDATEVIWGSEMFYAFYDAPELLRDMMQLVTETYIGFMRAWYGLVGDEGQCSTHWGFLHRGRLVIRNDSLMNLSPDLYVRYVRPMDERLFAEFGGSGAVHFCGRADHYIEEMSKMKGLRAVNLSEPRLNDMEVIYRNTVDKGIQILALDRHVAESADRPLRGQVHATDAGAQVFSHRRGP